MVRREIEKLFGDDFRELRLVADSGVEDVYGFLKCENYEEHIERVARSSVVNSVLPNYDNPHLLTDKEVSDFIRSAHPHRQSRNLITGDVVKVVSGTFGGLTGIVASAAGRGTYYVVFKFYLRSLCERLSGDELEFVDNIFDHIKSPATEGNRNRVCVGGVMVGMNRVEERIGQVANECKQYWQKHRESEKRRTA